jgi:hypothetical protein
MRYDAIMSDRANFIFVICVALTWCLLESPLLLIALICWHARRATDAAIRAELYPHLSARRLSAQR